ncbi:conserved hypothetical protein [Ricinus communis]|uniref:Chromo domain-containing protein n=1 Tax=Ricinus communis TaxID=3988 RepID=B9SNU3_RICCO|nr:conserved hypothetical protein [Ricinus communis]
MPYKGTPPASLPPLPHMENGCVIPTPASVTRARLNQGTWEFLVHWASIDAADAT